MTTHGFKTLVVSLLVLLTGVGLVLERKARMRLEGAVSAIHAESQRLAQEVASSQQEIVRLGDMKSDSTSPLQGQFPDVKLLTAEVARLRSKMSQLESAHAAVSNQLAAASGAAAPFIYSDSVKKKDYAYSGYVAPQSALHSMFWALSQSDPRAYLASVTGETAEAFASAIKDLPEGVMPGGYKNGAIFRASGYRVMEETPLSDDETRLKVFLEGRQNMVLKLVFKKVSGEWKHARTEF